MNERIISDKGMGDYDHVIDGEEVDLGGDDSPEHLTTTTSGRTSLAFIQRWKLLNNLMCNWLNC